MMNGVVRRRMSFCGLAVLGGIGLASPTDAQDGRSQLAAALAGIAKQHPGTVGVCVMDTRSEPICVNGDRRFSMQSVLKLVTGIAAYEAQERGIIDLDERVTIGPDQLSVHIQPIADIVRAKGSLTTTYRDLVERAVTVSDSAATDVVIARLGGPGAIQAMLDRRGFGSIRLDRDEKTMQVEISGLRWDPAYLDPGKLEAARARLSPRQKDEAFQAYLSDPRDTTTPEAMVRLLMALARGQILSPANTQQFLGVMARTVTFPGRLRAGAPRGWTVAHKTGTSHTHRGVNGVTNDVGLMTSPDGKQLAIAAFVLGSTAPAAERDRVIATAARAAAEALR